MGANNKRATIFIDGNNFYHGMRAIGLNSGTGFNYEEFSKKLVKTREWKETRYYTGRVKQEGDLTLYKTQRKLIHHLQQHQRINVFLGRLESHPTKGINKKLKRWLYALPHRNDIALPDQVIDELTELAHAAQGQRIWTEKAVDVMIATDIISMAYEDEYDVAYLISADGDFTPAVTKAREFGKQIIAASPLSGSQLAKAVDTFILMKRDFFHGCWL